MGHQKNVVQIDNGIGRAIITVSTHENIFSHLSVSAHGCSPGGQIQIQRNCEYLLHVSHLSEMQLM
jgi:hypothetical protein